MPSGVLPCAQVGGMAGVADGAAAGACALTKVATAIPAANIKEWITFNFMDTSPSFVFIAFVLLALNYVLLNPKAFLIHSHQN
jgi:predicted ABC-type sugar transport system permease subunit